MYYHYSLGAFWRSERLETREERERRLLPSLVQQQRAEVEQLRKAAAMKRMSVSQAVEDIKRYTLDHMRQDHLIVGFASEKANPFREKTWSCQLI